MLSPVENLCMIVQNGFSGRTKDVANFDLVCFGGGGELRGVDMGYGSYEVDGEVGTVVGEDVVREEGAKFVYNELVDGGFLDVFFEEGDEVGKEAVGVGGAVHAADDVFDAGCIACVEGIDEVFGELSFEDVADEASPEDGAAAFVAKDVSEAWCLLGKLLAVEDCAAASCAEDGYDAGVVAAEGACCSEEVGGYDLYFDTEGALEECLHAFCLVGTASGAVEEEEVGMVSGGECGTDFGGEGVADFFVAHEAGVDSR